MTDIIQQNPSGARPFSPIGLIRALVNRWGGPGMGRWTPTQAAIAAGPGTQGRYLKAAQPVLCEVSPAKVNPFPEPNTMPGGWDLSELIK